MSGVYWLTSQGVGKLYDLVCRIAVLSSALGVHPQEILDRHVRKEVHVLGQLGHQLLSGISPKSWLRLLAVDQYTAA